MIRHAWTCSCCGRQHDTLPMDFGAPAPDHWLTMDPSERASRAVLTSDLCTIDGATHFIRTCLEIPVEGLEDRLTLGVWVSLSETSLRRALEIWNDDEVSPTEPKRMGWLCTSVAAFPLAYELKAAVQFRGGGQRALALLEPAAHPLAIAQREGIDMARLEAIVTALMPRH